MQSLFNGPNNYKTGHFLDKQRAINMLKAQLSHLEKNRDFQNFSPDITVSEKHHKVQYSAYENILKAKNIKEYFEL